jgi:chemotaxis protein histidine kinase CheA
MALPKQVQAQIKEVEEIEKQLNAQSETVEKPKETKKKKVSKKAKKTEEVAADTEVEVTEEQPPEDEPVLEEAAPADDSHEEVTDAFEQKYSTLRGKYDAEVPRLHQQVRELTEQMDAIRKDAEAVKKVESEKPKEKVSYVTDADREEYGDDLIDFQRRVAKEASQEYEGRFEQQAKVIEELQKQISNTGSQVGEVGFAQKLNNLVPGFDQLDNDERWVSWLNEIDPMTRGPRRDQAQSAFNSGDADAVAHYVSLFRESVEPVANGMSDRQTELEKQVAPNRSASSTATRSVGKSAKIYSQGELTTAWTKIRTLSSDGKYDDAAKLEAELTLAYMEGRVKN